MNEQPTHLLTTMGVLTSFSISKKITEAEVNDMANKLKKTHGDEDVVEKVKAKIMNEIIKATKDGTLPGIILGDSKQPDLPIQQIEDLNRMVLVLSQKLKGKKLDKLSLCYFINFLVNSLGLTEEDFENFHRRLRGEQEDDDEEGFE